MAELRPWEGAYLKVSGVEIFQKMIKATALIPGKPEDLAVVLRRLEGFNPPYGNDRLDCSWSQTAEGLQCPPCMGIDASVVPPLSAWDRPVYRAPFRQWEDARL